MMLQIVTTFQESAARPATTGDEIDVSVEADLEGRLVGFSKS
jgi:hypothetical protein